MNQNIKLCRFDWYNSPEGEEFSQWEVGKDRGSVKVVSMLEHLPIGEGDCHYVEALLSDGSKARTYNVNFVVEFSTTEKEQEPF
jgi:hypothetical protein